MFLGDEYVEIVDRIGELAVRVFVDRVSQHQAYRTTAAIGELEVSMMIAQSVCILAYFPHELDHRAHVMRRDLLVHSRM
jgi:hypothetical protein